MPADIYSFAILVHVYKLEVLNDLVTSEIADGIADQVMARLRNIGGLRSSVSGFAEAQYLVCGYHENDEFFRGLIDTIFEVLSMPVDVLGYDVRLAASLGSVLSLGRAKPLDELIACARIAARVARKDGRSEHVRYSPRQRLEHARQLVLAGQIADGIEKNEFHSFYQPIATTDGNRIVGAESLCRWLRPGTRQVSPTTFIPVAEESGTIQALTSRVMASAFAQARRWRDGGFPLLLSVNMSPREFDTPGVVEVLDARARTAGLEPWEVQLEITESQLMADRRMSIRILAQLREHGFRIALDDFGKGYSSLSYFKDFQVDTVKIDKAFIQGVSSNTRNAAILRSIVSMTRDAGALAVAEGVETEEELGVVKCLGITHYQGYLLAQPCCALEFAEQYLRAPANRIRPHSEDHDN